MANLLPTAFPNGTNVLKSGPPAKTTICTVSRARLRRRNQTKRNPPRPGPQTNWKASGRFLFVWLRRRRRARDTVQIEVFVGVPLLETIVSGMESLSKKGRKSLLRFFWWS